MENVNSLMVGKRDRVLKVGVFGEWVKDWIYLRGGGVKKEKIKG